MSDYTVAQIEEIDEISDGRCPAARPAPPRYHVVRRQCVHGPECGRPDHQRARRGGKNEELYIVQNGRATFELDGERVDAPAGTLVFARPGVKRTAFAEEPGTTIVALGGRRARSTSLQDSRSGRHSTRSIRPASTPRRRIAAASDRAHPESPARSTTSRAARAWPGVPTMRSSTCGVRSSGRSGSARTPPRDSDFESIRRSQRSRNGGRGLIGLGSDSPPQRRHRMGRHLVGPQEGADVPSAG